MPALCGWPTAGPQQYAFLGLHDGLSSRGLCRPRSMYLDDVLSVACPVLVSCTQMGDGEGTPALRGVLTGVPRSF